MKSCTKCGVEKSLDEFPPCNRSRDGRQSRCRACKRAYMAERRARNGEHVRALGREHYQRHKNELCDRSRSHRQTHRDWHNAYSRRYAIAEKPRLDGYRKRWSAANREKRYAHSVLWLAIKKGDVQRRTACEDCGRTGRIAAHHDDYSKPLDVRWLCGFCHHTADEARRALERKAG